MSNNSHNIFSTILSKINFHNSKVVFGILIVLVLALIGLVMSDESISNRIFHSRHYDDKFAIEDTVETVVVEEVVEPVDEPAYTPIEVVEPQAEPQPEPDLIEPQPEPTPAPALKSDDEIKRSVEEETRVDDANKFYSVGSVEQMPSFPGGDAALYKYLSENLRYPADAQEEGISGRVVVQLTILKSGEVANVEVIRGRYPSLDKEAVRVVKSMPKWTPGKVNGHPVNVMYTLPITFRLQ